MINLGDAPVTWSAPGGWRVIEAVNTGTSDAVPPMAGMVFKAAAG